MGPQSSRSDNEGSTVQQEPGGGVGKTTSLQRRLPAIATLELRKDLRDCQTWRDSTAVRRIPVPAISNDQNNDGRKNANKTKVRGGITGEVESFRSHFSLKSKARENEADFFD